MNRYDIMARYTQYVSVNWKKIKLNFCDIF